MHRSIDVEITYTAILYFHHRDKFGAESAEILEKRMEDIRSVEIPVTAQLTNTTRQFLFALDTENTYLLQPIFPHGGKKEAIFNMLRYRETHILYESLDRARSEVTGRDSGYG